MHRALIAVALLSACAPRLGRPIVDHGEAATLPIVRPDSDRHRWYVVVDSPPRLFFLDTGYSYSTCDDDYATELGLELRGKQAIRGEAGRITTHRADHPTLVLGDHRVEGLVCLVRDLDGTSSISDSHEVDIAGVIGSDVLRRFRVVIDPERAVVELLPPTTAALERSDPGVVRIRREYWVGLRAQVPFQVAGKRLHPAVDTGATGTYLDGRKLGMEPTQVRQGVEVRGSGEQGRVVRDLALYQVDEAILAGSSLGPLTVVGRRRARWVPGLLGVNVLRHFRQEYDYASGLARFTPVRSGPIPSWQSWLDSARAQPAADETTIPEVGVP